MNRIIRSQWTPAVLIAALTIWVLVPAALTQPQFVDEQFYTWAGSYFWDRLTRLDFDARPGPRPVIDPGWNPDDWWFVSSPQGFRLLYAAVLKVTALPPPSRAFIWDERDRAQPEADVPHDTLIVLRLFSVSCATLGLAALGLRFRWSGFLGFVVLVNFPHYLVYVWQDVLWAPSHAMAEGPLLLGLGLCVLTYGSREFGGACALAASCKLTALGAWPLLLLPRASGPDRHAHWIGPASALALWVIVNPASWFSGGPLYLVREIIFRATEQNYMAATQPNAFGLYMPQWYLTPFLYGLAVGYAIILQFLLKRSPMAYKLRSRLERFIPNSS